MHPRDHYPMAASNAARRDGRTINRLRLERAEHAPPAAAAPAGGLLAELLDTAEADPDLERRDAARRVLGICVAQAAAGGGALR